MTRRTAHHPFKSPIAAWGLAAALGFLAGPTLAQKSDAATQGDLDFAKGLAEQWQFVGLAEEVLRSVEAGGVSPRRAEELALLKCDIFRSAALNERDRLRRNTLFDQAIGAYAEFLDRYKLSERKAAAELGMVRTAALYARSIEISLQEVVGEEAAALQEKRQKVLTEAVSRTGDLISSLAEIPEKSEAQRREYANLLLTRAQMLYDIGRTQDDGTFSFEQAIQSATNLAFFMGDGSPDSLRAYDLIGRIKAAQQDWEDAVGYFEAVVDVAIPADRTRWQEMVRELQLDAGAKEQRWLFLELSLGELALAYANYDDMAAATNYALHFYNTQRREGFSYSPSLGYPTLLTVARVLLDSGGWIGGNIATGDAQWFDTEEAARAAHARRNVTSAADLALRIAKQVKDDNQGNILQLRSQKLISEISNLPGIAVEPEMLLQAAQGEYHSGEYPASVEALQRLLAIVATKDDATRLRFGGEICWWMGRNFQRMDRTLEAAMCFREGVTQWQGDPNYDGQNAQQFYRMMEQVRATDREAPTFTALFREAENLSTRFATQNADEILFAQAERERQAENWAAAIAKYKEIGAGSDIYEKALVGIAECTYQKGTGDVAEAARLFAEYVEQYVTDPTRSVGDSPVRQRSRAEAMAKAEFYRALIAFNIAREKGDDEESWKRVLELASEYHEKYPDQSSTAPWTLEMTFEAHLRLKDLAAARQTYDTLSATFADSPRTARSAVRLYQELRVQRDAAIAGQNGESSAEELELEMAKLLEKGNQLASNPTYGNLRSESGHWVSLRRFDKAEPILRKIVGTFGESENAQEREGIRRYVLPDLGLVLLAQGRTGEARQVLEPLALDPANPPSKDTVVGYCRALVGWVEIEGGNVKIVPGAAETKEDLQSAITLYAKLDRVPDPWRCEWYAYKFQIAYAYYVWATGEGGPKDSSKLDALRRQLTQLTVEITETFDDVGKKCDAEQAKATVSIHGAGDLQAKFRWLLDRSR